MDSLKGIEALQRDLDRLESWTITSHMKFDKSKCQILHLGWTIPGHAYKLGGQEAGEQLRRKRSGGVG